MGKAWYKSKLLDVRKDRLDLRDRAYRPILKSLPSSYPSGAYLDDVIKCYRADEMVLDQGDDGACTGYALASIINYLLWKKMIDNNYKAFLDNCLIHKSEKVSAKMLFNLARIYDEWDGEDYEGSSCRGAMKGWHKHGVCREESWLFKDDEPQESWEKESIDKPLGAYYRVEKNSISDMQSAICEVGALYVSAVIHDGWWNLSIDETNSLSFLKEALPSIMYEAFPQGKHAFIIVGYNRDGFIIQNSWGRKWGNFGFALLTYKEWLANGLDVWVAVMGVPIEMEKTPQTFSNLSLSSLLNESVKGNKTIKKAFAYVYKHKALEPISEALAYEHTLVLNSNGRAKHTIIATSSVEKSTEIICYEKIKSWLKKNEKNRKIAIYALGGLKNEKDYMAQIRILQPYFINNGIYPIFLIWKNSYLEAIESSIEGFFHNTLANNILEMEDEKVLQDQEALNRAIENHSKQISTRAIWSEIKEKALNANMKSVEGFNEETNGSLYILTDALKRLNKECMDGLEIHAMAHSAGSQLLTTTWLKALEKRGLMLSSMHLLAPTVSIQDCNKYMIDAYEKGVFKKDKIFIYLLSKKMESSDSVGHYSQSLLYLISRSLEKIHKTPLLGLKNSWDKSNSEIEDGVFNTQQLNEVKKWLTFADKKDQRFKRFKVKVLGKTHKNLRRSRNNDSVELNHKNLDSSIYILEKALKVMVDGKLDYRVEYLG